MRSAVINNGMRYTFAYSLYWTIAASLYGFLFLNGDEWTPLLKTTGGVAVINVFVVVVSARGLVTVAVWWWTHDVAEAWKVGGRCGPTRIHTVTHTLCSPRRSRWTTTWSRSCRRR